MARSLDSELSAMAATSGPSTANCWCSVRAAPSSRVRSRCASVSAGSSHHGSHTSPTVTSAQRASVNPAMWSWCRWLATTRSMIGPPAGPSLQVAIRSEITVPSECSPRPMPCTPQSTSIRHGRSSKRGTVSRKQSPKPTAYIRSVAVTTAGPDPVDPG